MTEQEINSLSIEQARAKIVELESFLDEANAHHAWAESDGKKWKARFEWLAKSICHNAHMSITSFPPCVENCEEVHKNNIRPDSVQCMADIADKEMER